MSNQEIIERAAASIEHINSSHADTVIFVARHHLGCVDATDAELADVDREGVDVHVTRNGAIHQHRLSFSRPIQSQKDLQQEFFEIVADARSRVGTTTPLTSIERELAQRPRLRSHAVTVVRRERLAPNLLEVVVTGDFEGFGPSGGDDFVYVIVPRSGKLPDGYDMALFMEADPETRPFGAYYTVRHFDSAHRELTLWMVDHGHADGVGGWATSCQPGDRAVVWGPREGAAPPVDGTPIILAVDESGWAAAAGIASSVPPDTPVRIIAESNRPENTVELDAPTTWVFRESEPAGHSGALLAALKTLDATDTATAWFFGAGESREMTALRRYLRSECGLPATAVTMVGYWRATMEE